jgi:DNA-binding PadR family transcriptional regulator
MAKTSIGSLELAILLTTARLGGEAYSANVRRELNDALRREYSIGAVHSTLQRLEDKGLLGSSMGDPTPRRGGRARRCYRVTSSGRATLARAREARDALWAGIRLAPRAS